MPLSIPKTETLSEFEAAREDRFRDGIVLALKGRRMGATYLLGYTVEITLKCAFFRLWGYRDQVPIQVAHADDPRPLAVKDLGLAGTKEPLHNPFFWARLIIRVREELDQPLGVSLSSGLLSKAMNVAANWRVAMRYWRTRTTPRDFRGFVRDVMWFRTRYDELWR